MKRFTVNRRETNFFSDFANQINDNQEALKKYIQNPFSLQSFKHQIELKKTSYPKDNREVLTTVLTEQLSSYLTNEKVKANLELLKQENTFTVTTGHQLNMFGGPLYLIYKIVDTVRLAEKLSGEYPEYNFVPIFWMATEDHDFEEINHLHLFRDTIRWKTNQKGPVGRFELQDIDSFKEQVAEKFQNSPEFAKFINAQYTNGNFTKSTTDFLMDLVETLGVIIIDADDARLKRMFLPYIQKELETHFAEKAIQSTTEALEKDGYFGQAHARPINLFYIQDQFRERIIPLENGNFEIGEKEFERDFIFEELEKHPEKFSPNVVFRPLYQETISPNLCYLGGGGEMAYWLQLKGMFDETNVPYPLIKVRNSAQWIDKTTAKRLDKLEIDYADIFKKDIDELKKDFVLDASEEELDFSSLDTKTKEFINELENTIINIDKGLDGYAKSEITRIQKQVDVVKQKMVRHQKKKHEDAMNQIDNIYEKMFPNNGLQERFENTLPYLERLGIKEYVSTIYNLIENPFETDLIVYVEK